jgi:5-methyltetrahydrofolate--homocysteine methyltransferase
MIYNDNFERTKKYAKAFWEKELIDRPYVCVTAPKKDAKPVTEGVFHSPTNSFKATTSGDYLPILQTYEKVVASTFYGGEALPTFEVTLGPDQYAAFLGAEIKTRDGFFTTWSEPCVSDWSDFPIALNTAAGSSFDKVKKFMEFAAEYSRDKFFINMLDLHSNMDALSALRGPMDLCYDIMDEPEIVLHKLEQVNNTYDAVYRMAYEAADMKNRGTIGWSPIYCEGRSAVVQCDFSCMLSPAQAREFVIPSIQREAAYLDHCVYHYDGKEALGHLDDVLAIKEIDCIQWVPGDGQPRSLEWIDLLKKIQKAGKSVWIYDWTAEEIKAHFKELEPNKVAFSLSTATEDEAESLLEYLVKNT